MCVPLCLIKREETDPTWGPGTIERNTRMALKITAECINCGACEAECPNQAITAGADIYVIDAAKCTECKGHADSPSCAAVCPVDCCKK